MIKELGLCNEPLQEVVVHEIQWNLVPIKIKNDVMNAVFKLLSVREDAECLDDISDELAEVAEHFKHCYNSAYAIKKIVLIDEYGLKASL